MPFETIILKKEDHIATIILNRPERLNAVNEQMVRELLAAVEDVAKDDESRVLVITGAGRGFCAGADVARMAGGAIATEEPTAEEFREQLKAGAHQLILGLRRMEKPTVAMVNGVCVGGGFDLALACDIRIGSENARFRNAFVIIGLVPGWGGTWLYPRVMGVPKALEYLLTGDFIDAYEAEKLGVLNRLVSTEELEKETMELARKIANGPPIAIKLMKMQVYKGLGTDLETALDLAATCETITIKSEDHKEGVAAFREKRQPEFKGR